MTDSDEVKPEVETLLGVDLEDKRPWEQRVREAAKDRCSNCGGEDRTRVSMIVPIDAGGQAVVSNGVLLCRPCEMASESLDSNKKREQDRRILNFWVSRKFYDRLQKAIDTQGGFNSVSSLVRYLMSKYVIDEARFDDLEQHQDSGADVKINVWVDIGSYATFKRLVDKRGMTVTDAVKNLILVYLETMAELGAVTSELPSKGGK